MIKKDKAVLTAYERVREEFELAVKMGTKFDVKSAMLNVDALLKASADNPSTAGTKPIGYARESELAKLADDRIAGIGMMIHKEAGEGKVALYLTAPAAQDSKKE